MRILAVDDEPQILRTLARALGAQGHEVVPASNAREAIEHLAAGNVDVLLLDLGLPGMDGLSLMEQIRSWSAVPVIVLSVRDQQADKVSALDAGADDYLTKPFGIEELVARIRAVQRRIASGEAVSQVVRAGDLEIDLARQVVKKKGEYVHLTPTEFALLDLFARNPEKLLTHRFLVQQVWGDSQHAQSNYLRVYVAGLRKKLEEDPANPILILTEPGLGYRWMAS